jgi:glyoxylase-like metal-dependent hydrolase (beta-lactamase superfamily II)
MSTRIPLEDKAADIIGKAIRGNRFTNEEVAARSGVPEAAVTALREGRFDAAAARSLAPALGLGAAALVETGLEQWYPHPVEVAGLACFNTVFEDMTVNSYLVYDPAAGTAVAFDTGSDCSEMLDFLAAHRLRLEGILITHSHGDHIFDLDRLKEKTAAPAWIGNREPLEGTQGFEAGHVFSCGKLRIETRLTWGHSKGGITYVISGLERPVAVVGDAVFAGSMGGGGVSYADALRTNREEILTLPDQTVLCPGHGPLTTVGEEKAHNPFFAV